MIGRLFQQLINSCGIVFRTFRAFFMRQILGITARIRRLTSFSRQAAKMVPKALQVAAVAGKKPTKRADYVETKRLFISKSFLVLMVIGLLALGALGYFLVWPWMQSAFFTAHMVYNDERVTDYNGKVVLYYDEDKKQPMLKTKLEEGVAQGTGTAYDEQGLTVYVGAYANGLYEGKGQLFKNGVLCYEGDFVAGVYEGNGLLYDETGLIYEGSFSGGLRNGEGTQYQSGVMLYKGGFLDDLYDGTGSEYNQDGALLYRGGFVQGQRSDQGTEYYPSGQVKFRGTFLEGKYEGTSILYNEDGTKRYEGGFGAGQYQGQGKLYLDDGAIIEAEFDSGAPFGEIKMYRNGRLYYEGEANNIMPNGNGTLYASDGTVVYRGLMRDGTIDAGSLLGMSAEEARTAFADAKLTENRSTKGFSMTNASLGVTLFLTLKSEDSDPTVYYVYQYDKGADTSFELMPWETTAQYEAWCASHDIDEPIKKTARSLRPNFVGEVPFDKQTYFRTMYDYPDYTFAAWSMEEGGTLFMVEWFSSDDLPDSAGATSSEEGGSGERLDALLGKLGLEEQEGTTSDAPTSAYYGENAPNALLQENQTPELTQTILHAMVDYLEQAEKREAWEEQLSVIDKQLEAQQSLVSMGMGNPEAIAALESERGKVELQVNQCAIGMKKAQVNLESVTQGQLSDYNLQKALFVMDPVELDLTGLATPTDQDTQIKLALMNLELGYQQIQQAQTEYETAAANLESMQADYEIAKATQTQLYEAQRATSNARIVLYEALCAYSRQMIDLNTLTDGYLAKTYTWHDTLLAA